MKHRSPWRLAHLPDTEAACRPKVWKRAWAAIPLLRAASWTASLFVPCMASRTTRRSHLPICAGSEARVTVQSGPRARRPHAWRPRADVLRFRSGRQQVTRLDGLACTLNLAEVGEPWLLISSTACRPLPLHFKAVLPPQGSIHGRRINLFQLQRSWLLHRARIRAMQRLRRKWFGVRLRSQHDLRIVWRIRRPTGCEGTQLQQLLRLRLSRLDIRPCVCSKLPGLHLALAVSVCNFFPVGPRDAAYEDRSWCWADDRSTYFCAFPTYAQILPS